MRVTLIQPPLARHDAGELTPPLGLLMLASVLEHDDFDVAIVDLNLAGLEDPSWNGLDPFVFAERAIAATTPDLVGFTSMALEAHVCLEVARRLKARDPCLHVVLGGPHFSSTAGEILEGYPWIDFVVLGEGEQTFSRLCRSLRRGLAPGRMANLAERACLPTDEHRRFKPHSTLDALPEPAYHLVDLERYFRVNPRRMVSIEHARGCALRCEFCYSPVHWGQGEQRRSTERIQRELERLHAAGVQHFFFVSDNFLNSRPAALALSAAITELDLDVSWNGYATLAQINPEMAVALAESGCRALFVGVDAVTERHKRQFKKSYFRGWDDLRKRLGTCIDHGIVPTCAFLVEPPKSDASELDATLQIAAFTRTLGCNVTLNPLTVYSGTGLSRDGRPVAYSDAKPRLLFDTHAFNCDNPLAKTRPALFPCHNTFHDEAAEKVFCTSVFCAHAVLKSYPWTLIRHALDSEGSTWRLVRDLASRCGDLTSVPPLERRDRVRRIFGTCVKALPSPDNLHSVVEFEARERQVFTMKPERLAATAAGNGNSTSRLSPYALMSLSVSPARLFTYEAIPDSERDQEEAHYLIVARHDRVDYFVVSDDLASRIPSFHDALERLASESSHDPGDDSPGAFATILAEFGIFESEMTINNQELVQ